MNRLAPMSLALGLAFAGAAAADPAPIVYAGSARAEAGLAGGDSESYNYGATTSANAPLDLRAPSNTGNSASDPGAQPWLERERVGPPYQVGGRVYVPTPEPGYQQTGRASWYGPTFHGRRAANGDVFDQEAMTAAHPTLPLNSLVQVTNLENGREVIVRVNDRGPFVDNRLIDLSRGAAAVLGFERAGGAQVHVRYLGPAPRRVAAAASTAAPSPSAGVEPTLAVSGVEPTPIASGGDPALPAAGGHFVQVGAFSDLDNVQRVREAAGAVGPVRVDAGASASGSEVYRVRVGPFAAREEALAAQAALSGLGYYDAALVSR